MPDVLAFVPSSPNQRRTFAIDGAAYHFDARWNAAEGAWYLDILEEDETPIVNGAKLTVGTFLGARSTHPIFNMSAFVAVDTGGRDADPGLDDLGARVEVRRYTAEEIMATVPGLAL